MKTYYLAEFKYPTKSYCCIWYSGEVDGFQTENNALVYFDSFEEAKQYCAQHEIRYVEDEVSKDDIGKVEQWLSDGGGEDVDCDLLLRFWNSVTDLAATFGIEYIGNERMYTNIYEKLFYGNNLPTINTSGRTYISKWTEGELLALKEIIDIGVNLFAESFERYGA